MTMEKADMVIVGAGFAGLAMARTYLKLNPDVNLLILDAGTSIGGVWAADRLYPHLRTISQLGHFEYSDFPMTGRRYGVAEGEHMKGEVMQQYLQDYADAFDLTRRTRLDVVVREAEDKGAAGWLLTTTATTDESTNEPTTHQILASILVVATGLTSTPSMPSFPGQSHFGSPVLHSRDFGRHASSILNPSPSPSRPRTIAVLSGNKSACDVVYAACSSSPSSSPSSPPPTTIHWLLRATGHGPCWMAPPRTAPPADALVEELITTRFNTWLASPCIWGAADGFGAVRRVVNRTAWGRGVVRRGARGAEEGLVRRNYGGGGDGDDVGGKEVAKLRPWGEMWWIGTGRGLLNYGRPCLLDYVRAGRVRVHVADVEGLGPGGVVRLSDGEELAGVDALVCCTGWEVEPSVRFVRRRRSKSSGSSSGSDGGDDVVVDDMAAELGLPHAYDPAVDDDPRRAALVARADEEILTSLPLLRDQPAPATCPPRHLARQSDAVKAAVARRKAEEPHALDTPRARASAYTLYRFMVPPSRGRCGAPRRTIAFIGQARTASTALISQAQALWLSAYFMGRLPHLSNSNDDDHDEHDDIEYDAVLHARQTRFRYPLGFGPRIPDFTSDALPYMDLLLHELGLRRWRKRWTFSFSSSSLFSFSFSVPNLWREVFEWYGPVDYRGLVEEWAGKEGVPVLEDGGVVDGGGVAGGARGGRRKGETAVLPPSMMTGGFFLVTAVLGAVAAAAGVWVGVGRRES
ncbi:flavin-binding monooxygenase-like protein [Diplodia corticola]|uniref:Flavin-binding monooxygenase-like protein n=1 Tax=Diplodia corticola TaxID=236234 RepID=A0A1J9RQA1_9PEZI|nr:flavin-binding monooxygenase-like protein [Diplodia corticola]OJD30076.1 flavin-binding monooxygenase-like protein [Diplodia corticola]